MKWSTILAFGLVFIVLIGIAAWGYRFFVAPESIESVSAKWVESGHADAASHAFTNWDENEPPLVPSTCAKCHSLYGYLDFLGADGTQAGQIDKEARVGSVIACNACHNPQAHQVTQVTFPSGIEVTENSRAANCMQCHQGRAAVSSVDKAIAGLDADTVSTELSFINVHYAIAAATLLGNDAQGGYQYAGKSYVGRFAHVEDYATCSDCHDPHNTTLNPDTCSPCHSNVVERADLHDIRQSAMDYDGDGEIREPIASEIGMLHDTLYVAIKDYAANIVGQPIIYDKGTHPYFFNDTNANGIVDSDEANGSNRYAMWTPRLLQATYNYQFVAQDPGAYTHNARYVLQLLYDSLENLDRAVPVDNLAHFVRP
ncbi:MAG: polyheme membrane-associated cytochrome C [Anaerolineae bacterium]|nr:polyheme membrane-associated cytochrome C [Anaerolineae bacterium]